MDFDATAAFAAALDGATADRPFQKDDATVLRHKDSRKWFGLCMRIKGESIGLNGTVEIVNLKCDPDLSPLIRQQYKSALPAYHMSKVHWITVVLGGDVPDDELKKLILHSFALTDTKRASR